MKLSDKESVQQIIITLAELGLKEVIISPGSRNAPFILSFNRYPAFHCTSIRDERSAGFFALGKIIELKQPVAIVCTSGSATLNFAPAIAEAYYQRLPLLVITSDRPKEWIGQGDGQTINQEDIYDNYIRAAYKLNGDAAGADDRWYNARCLSEGYAIATTTDPGPVHFNVFLREPLYDTSHEIVTAPRIFKPVTVDKIFNTDAAGEFKKMFSSAKKVMLLCGQHAKDTSYAREIEEIAAFDNTIVLTESTSNIHNKDYVENIDRCITTMKTDEVADFMPDLLITTGNAVVSKRIKSFLRKYKPRQHWHIDPYDAFVDTYQSLTHPVFMKPSSFLAQLGLKPQNVDSDYKRKWLDRKSRISQLHDDFCKKAVYSDFFVFEKIYDAIPHDICVHLSNSSPIRYAQLFDNKNLLSTWSNRGTSGIDGCTSTAMGAAAASPENDFLLITGDVAFYYDINALWNEAGVQNLKIILINNGGGGIFRIISGKEAEPEMEEFFETAQDRNAEKIAATYQWDYLSAHDAATLKTALEQFFDKRTKRTILEIFTPSEINPQVLDQYWNYLKENI